MMQPKYAHVVRRNHIELDYSLLIGSIDQSKERVVAEEDSPSWLEIHLFPYRYALPFAEGKDVLEIGCGNGYGTALLAEVASEVVAFDLHEEPIEYARKRFARYGNIRFLVHDAGEPFPVPDAYFDLVFSSEAIEHIERWETTLDEICRVLRPGGLCILKTPNALFARKDNPFHRKVFTAAELEDALAARFDNVVLWGFGIGFSHSFDVRPSDAPTSARRFGEPVALCNEVVVRGWMRPVLYPDPEEGADLLALCRKR